LEEARGMWLYIGFAMVGLGFLLALGWRPSGRVPTILRGHEAPPRS